MDYLKLTPDKVKKMSPEEKAKVQEKINLLRVEYNKQLESLNESNPFWSYEPSDGVVGIDRQEFLKRWLKPEDVPHGTLQSQLDVHKSTANLIVALGGNQGGKSSACAVEAFIWATGEVPDSLKSVYPAEKIPKSFPQYIRVVGVDHKTLLSSVIPTYQRWCPREFLKDGSWEKSYSHEQRTLDLVKGGKLISKIEFMTNQQDVESFQGPPRHGVIYDEEPRLDIYQENLLRFATADRVKILFGMTPTHGISWVKDEIYDKADDKDRSISCFKIPSITNKRVNLHTIEEGLKGLSSYEEVKMRLLGEFVSLSGLVYGSLFNPSVHVVEPFTIDKNYIVLRGLDPHLVKPTVCVEMAVDREGNKYIIGCYSRDADTEDVKKDLAERVGKYRLGWTVCDKSANSTIKVFGDRNIYLELSRGKNAVPALFTSEKWTGSINAGVDEIKKSLKLNDKGKPSLFFFNTAENKLIINAIRSIERDTYADEGKDGIKDKIREAKHDAHAAMRYIFQRPIRWIPEVEVVPEYEPVSEAIGY